MMVLARDLTPLHWALVTLWGAAVGSFLNVVIYRLPNNKSLMAPPSHCTSCGARLRARDLIPVLSYVIARGRCRYCCRPYSPRYALVELTAGLLAAASVCVFGVSAYAGGVFAAICALIVVIFVDLDHMIIPDETVVVVAIVGLLFDASRLIRDGMGQFLNFTERYGGLEYTVHLPRSVVGALLGAGLFLFISWFFSSLMHKPVMGMGDVKLAGAMGAILGPGYGLFSYFLLSVIIGAVVSVGLILFRVRRRQDYIPFGPMMAAAGIIMLLAQDKVAPFVLGFYSL
jgi:leader peptidase (prepilin peptidase) / N-methyltransferase